jgi:hypothetical protein
MITSMATIIANCTGDAGTRTPSPGPLYVETVE